MKNDFLGFINKGIAYCFYLIFFSVPLVMFPYTFELFEFNKMWVVFGLSLIIFLLWICKIVLTKRLEIRRTPLDIPILLFLVSQIISTIISIDSHVSFWGYYSRFNGGLLSTISYIFLYYAFASNLIPSEVDETKKPFSYKILFASLLSGLAVSLWGLPSHFGKDLTCFVFRGTLDTSCWTEAFKPTIREFSTLGQPNWLGTFLAILIPVAIGFGIINIKSHRQFNDEKRKSTFLNDILYSNRNTVPFIFLGIVTLFYLSMLYTRSQSSFIGSFVGLQVFFALLFIFTIHIHKFSLSYLWNLKYTKFWIALNLIFFLVSFVVRPPVNFLDKYTTYEGLKNIIVKEKQIKTAPTATTKTAPSTTAPAAPGELGGTDSGTIRKIVWNGAIEIFKQNPLFGTGVETFAYAYYKVKPVAHNLTSEWDYLYNKAHNEYLNYLATTGIFGLGTYLLIIGMFFFVAVRDFLKKKTFGYYFPISISLIGSYIAILISNFFGFSVVIVNLFFFFIPLLFLEMEHPYLLKKTFVLGKREEERRYEMTTGKAALIVIAGIIVLYMELFLLNFWMADQKYAYGNNLDKIGEYTQAYQHLNDSVQMRDGEDIYRDELSVNLSTLALLSYQQNQTEQAKQFMSQAKQLSDEVILNHPNNVVFFKSRTRVLYAISQIDPQYLEQALNSLNRAQELAPTDAKIAYNLALFHNQKKDNQKSVNFFNKAISLKPNYIDARYGLALLYSQMAKEDKNWQEASELKIKARGELDYILKNIDPTNKQAKELLKNLENG